MSTMLYITGLATDHELEHIKIFMRLEKRNKLNTRRCSYEKQTKESDFYAS